MVHVPFDSLGDHLGWGATITMVSASLLGDSRYRPSITMVHMRSLFAWGYRALGWWVALVHVSLLGRHQRGGVAFVTMQVFFGGGRCLHGAIITVVRVSSPGGHHALGQGGLTPIMAALGGCCVRRVTLTMVQVHIWGGVVLGGGHCS